MSRGGRLAGILCLVPGLLVGGAGCQPASEPARSQPTPPTPPAATVAFVGLAKCAGCHPKEAEAYRGSDHARAMEPATAESVLGDFDNARFTHRGATSTFFRRDGRFFVRTDGPDGKPGDFPVAYTFGADPLQQYLVPFPDGRLQALGMAWDSRPKAQGGQRWFHLYPRERLTPSDPLHWTGREQTWNVQCAECHSTDLQKHYDLGRKGYDTRWAELTVSCEACHGPGAAHVAWAEARPAGAPRAPAGATGLVVRLGAFGAEGRWIMKDLDRGVAEWSGPARSAAEVEMCARCHARRRAIVDPYPYGKPFLDTHVPALLEAGLYHADGQILGEVYEYGSFVQTRMFRAGVTCADCHDPHGLAPRRGGNAVCTPCHHPARFDVPSHHRHRPGSEAARCVACHMPARTYMQVDPRRDHSFRVPRPDLSVALGTPDVCTGCHRERSAAWAAAQVVAWHGRTGRARRPHFAPALDAGRRGLPTAGTALAALAIDAEQPGIARATALALLPEYLSAASMPAVEAALGDGDPLVRAAAVGALEALAPEVRVRLAAPRLRDPVRAVRLAAAHALADTARSALETAQQADFERALAELIASEAVNADRPEAHVNLATLSARLGRPADSESELRTALVLDPGFVPALVNLADLFRAQGRDADGERFLEGALRAVPDSAEVLHSLGLLRVRQGRRSEALDLLRRAAERRPESVRFAYVYAVARHSTGDAAGAIATLEAAHRRRPASRDVLVALVTYLREQGDARAALGYAERLRTLAPEDPGVRGLVESLRREAGAPK
jgi:Tfp pilus assembly protein PilF